MKKSILVMASLLALALAGSAQAATRFAVQNSGGTDTFAVDETGAITTTLIAPKMGVNTNTPTTTFHVAASDASALRGITSSQHNDGAQGGVMNFLKSRGTQAAPTQPIANDYIGLFAAQFWNGTAYDRSAQLGFRNDAAVSPGVFPTAIMFFTGTHALGTSDVSEAMRVSSSKNVIVGNAGGTATTDMATTVTNGFLYIPTVAGALTSCASVTTHAGHVPVWFDTTNAKVCTCQAGVLKCTAALN